MKMNWLQMSVKPTFSEIVCITSVLIGFISSVSSSCTGSTTTLSATDDISTFTSPGYSTGSYDNDLSCSWLIDSGSSSDKIIIFITHYDVTSPDVIVIHNGFSSSNATLTTAPGLSGTGTNKDYLTTGQYALVLFTTDSSGQAQGFTMQYLKASDLSGTGCSAEQTLTASSTDQFLTSPAFPNAYTGNANCRWLIQAPEGTVHFQLLLSDIENSPNCGFDYLKIYDSSYVCEHTLTVAACTRYPGTTATYTSNGTSVLVLFVSDVSVGYKGFKLKFSSVTTTTPATTASTTSQDSDFALGVGVGLAAGIVSTLMTIGIIQIIKSRIQASKLGSPRVRNVIPMNTPSRISGSVSSASLIKTQTNGHVPNGHASRSHRISMTSSQSSSGNSSRNGRTPSTGHNSPEQTTENILNNKKINTTTGLNNNYKRNNITVF